MIADGSTSGAYGKLAAGIVDEGRSRSAILDFIQDQLPRWRDRPDRRRRSGETALTSDLCAHLNSAARRSPGWDCLQFRQEQADEANANRKIDLIAAAAGDALLVEGRCYSDFDTILPIECKRLPIPPSNKRDEREYVITEGGCQGGIQRYKEGQHGAAHERAALIAYVQKQGFEYWLELIGTWINELCRNRRPGWSLADALTAISQDDVVGIAVHESVHARDNLPDIHMRHMWVRM